MKQRIGRRGTVLAMFGGVFVLLGIGLATGPRTPPFALAMVSNVVLGAMWVIVGVICIVFAIRHYDRWAYGLATALSAMWAFGYFFSWILSVDKPWIGGSEWVGAAVWGLVAGLLYVISGWPENRK